MQSIRKPMGIVLGLAVIVIAGVAVVMYWQAKEAEQRKADAQAMCEQWADRLDKQTTDSGIYIRWNGNTLPDSDPWGNPLRVSYSQGGVSEMVEVRSLGSDGHSHTEDDIAITRVAMNFKGLGTGLKEGIEDTSAKAAKGLVKGTIAGIKDAVGLGKKIDDKEK
jgi:hypothetical protein